MTPAMLSGTNTSGARSESGTTEPARRNANDRQWLAIDHDLFAEHRRARAERVLPEGVAQHRHVVAVLAARGLVVSPREQAAERRLNAEHREIRSRYQDPVAVDRRLPGQGEVDAERHVASDPAERRLRRRFLEVAEHRVVEDLEAVTGHAAVVEHHLRARSGGVDQSVGVCHRGAAARRISLNSE